MTESQLAEKPMTEPSKPNLARKTILIVDDEKDYRAIVAMILTHNGYAVFEADNGVEALGIIARNHVDLVIADFRMPQMNGYELIQGIRSQTEIRKTPIIMVTGASNRQNLKTLDMDISDFLEKPIANQQLLGSVQAALGL